MNSLVDVVNDWLTHLRALSIRAGKIPNVLSRELR
jgi:hypothetical protein